MASPKWPSTPWDDILLLEDFLTEEERMIRDGARDFCQNELMPGILDAGMRISTVTS